MPCSAAMMRHGELLPSCSIAVMIISSPASKRGARARAIVKVIVVMFAANTISRSDAAL
jgi:hypothetical protein